MDFAATMLDVRDNSFLQDMIMDPETEQNAPNQQMRQVRAGHYVIVAPTPLPKPRLVLCNEEHAAELGISETHCKSEDFTRFFSGDIDAVPDSKSWATPYALSLFRSAEGKSVRFPATTFVGTRSSTFA